MSQMKHVDCPKRKAKHHRVISVSQSMNEAVGRRSPTENVHGQSGSKLVVIIQSRVLYSTARISDNQILSQGAYLGSPGPAWQCDAGIYIHCWDIHQQLEHEHRHAHKVLVRGRLVSPRRIECNPSRIDFMGAIQKSMYATLRRSQLLT